MKQSNNEHRRKYCISKTKYYEYFQICIKLQRGGGDI